MIAKGSMGHAFGGHKSGQEQEEKIQECEKLRDFWQRQADRVGNEYLARICQWLADDWDQHILRLELKRLRSGR